MNTLDLVRERMEHYSTLDNPPHDYTELLSYVGFLLDVAEQCQDQIIALQTKAADLVFENQQLRDGLDTVGEALEKVRGKMGNT